uniref:GCS light chain n=1 Tax=Anas zonorhyncha TaxID=75864 RepID=A0A8B9U047_9AVES
MARSALGVAQLDSVIIAPPPTEDGNSLSEYLQPSWQELESLVQNKKIVTIYTSDFDKTLLEQVYVWAQVKPSSNQVNLASCCVMPLDLTALAKQVVIQLLTEIMTQKNYFMKQVSKKFFGIFKTTRNMQKSFEEHPAVPSSYQLCPSQPLSSQGLRNNP